MLPSPAPSSGFNANLESLIGEAARDGREPMVKLFRLLAPRIKTYAVMGGASNEEANNLVIETLLTLKREASRFDPNRMAASTFVFRIMRNWRLALRRKEFRPMPDPADPNFAPDPLGEPDAQTFRKAAEDFSTFVSGLDDDEKKILRNSFSLGRHYTVTDEEMLIPLPDVQQHIRNIVKKLQIFFRELS